MPKIGQRRIVVALAVVLSIIIAGLALTASEIGITSGVGNEGLPISASDLSAVPQSVVEDANRLATEIVGDSQERCDDFVNQLLATYLEANDKDFVILFNPGGWGYNLVERSPGWWSIFTGIESELNSSGYKSLLLTHQRTINTLQGRLDEIEELLTGYSSKANDLAYRVEFLTTHIPDLSVILTGDSNGTVICDKTLNILGDNPRVYSIQTGPPFWHANIMSDRTLIMTDNGITPDSFSRGDFLAMVRANLKALIGLSQPEEDSGTILHFLRAPGHDYQWQYPEVSSQIKNFLVKIGIKWS